MKNGEKYRDEIMKHYEDCNDYCHFVNDIILKPLGFDCNGAFACSQCNAIQRIWLDEEYKEPEEPKVDWSKVAVDTQILVSDNGINWCRRYFSKYKDGLVFAWKYGVTSWSAENKDDCIDCEYAKLAEGEK